MSAPAQLYMDAVITPNRSLSRGGLIVLLGFIGFYNVMLAVFMVISGAFPVPVFLGLDFLGVWLAFRISNKRAKRAERVRVSSDEVEVERDLGRGSAKVWSSPTAFTRVAVADPGRHEARVELSLSGRRLFVGAALSPEERTAFGEALKDAVAAARSERHPHPAA
jgi:uncharacterized membrane protein